MLKSQHKLESEESGQSLVEFALVLLFVILPFMFVLADSAVTLYTYVMITNAAREGAHAGSIYQTTTSPAPNQDFATQVAAIDTARAGYVQQETRLLLGTLIDYTQCNTVVTYRPDPPDLGNTYRQLDSLTVQLACPRRLFFGLIGTTQITLTAQATMRIEPGGVGPSP